MSAKDKLMKRIDRLEKAASKGRFLSHVKKMAETAHEDRLSISFLLLEDKDIRLLWEAGIGKNGRLIDTGSVVHELHNGTVRLRHLHKEDKFHAESELPDGAGRKFGKLLHRFGLTRKLPKGSNPLSRKDYDKGLERLIEYCLNKTDA